jgi:ubiquinone/menaquinone biosynthesis C-methylase UbiE
MGEYDPSSAFADSYFDWYEDHSGRRSAWLRGDLIARMETCRPLRGARVLDFGCGTGSSAVVMAEQGAEVVGADAEAISLDIAACRARDLGLQARCSFIRIPYVDADDRLPFLDASFDRCALIGVLEHMKTSERMACAAEIHRILRPGGDLFIFDTPNRAFPKDLHTTLLWFVGWMPERLARAYAIFRKRFESNQDFRRYGGIGISRRQIDRLFPHPAWSLSYEKTTSEVIGEYARLMSGSSVLTAMNYLARSVLRVIDLSGGRLAFWTASHAIGFTKTA